MDSKIIDEACTPDWQDSYLRGENFCFVASDEVVRFVSRYLVKRIGIKEYKSLNNNSQKLKVLDACCGIGRNVIFGKQMGLEMYGFDLSSVAIQTAEEFYNSNFPSEIKEKRFIVSGIDSIPWDNSFFDHVICESALDSMSFNIAKKGIEEISRVIKNDGIFYCSLISGEKKSNSNDKTREEIVVTQHEKGTIQSYFDKKKIFELMNPYFKIINIELHNILVNDSIIDARWHIVAQKIN